VTGFDTFNLFLPHLESTDSFVRWNSIPAMYSFEINDQVFVFDIPDIVDIRIRQQIRLRPRVLCPGPLIHCIILISPKRHPLSPGSYNIALLAALMTRTPSPLRNLISNHSLESSSRHRRSSSLSPTSCQEAHTSPAWSTFSMLWVQAVESLG
jgi:hypothetical protein